jgi:GT2 family glycosyltransferase
MPTCSVIVLNWNGRHHLRACLESLRRQTYSDFEVILVDNGSTDGSAEYVRHEFPWVRLHALERNLMFCAGNNAGIRNSLGRYVVLLNNDTEVEIDWLFELVAAAEANPEAGSFASRMLIFDDRQVLDSAGNEYAASGAAAKRGHLSRADGFDKPAQVFGACAGAALYRRAMLDDIGLLDEDITMVFEDVDIGFRAQLAGYGCLYVPTARAYHKVNASIGTFSRDYVYYGQRNIEFVFFKNMPARLLLRHLPGHILYNALALAFFASRWSLGAYLNAKIDAVFALPRILRKRRRIQSGRRVSDRTIAQLFAHGWIKQRWVEKRPRALRSLGSGPS